MIISITKRNLRDGAGGKKPAPQKEPRHNPLGLIPCDGPNGYFRKGQVIT